MIKGDNEPGLTRKEISEPTAFSLLSPLFEKYNYQPEDAEFILYFALLIGRELNLPAKLLATLKYGPLIGTSAKIELDRTGREKQATPDPSGKITPYLNSFSSVFTISADEKNTLTKEFEDFEYGDWLLPDYLDELEEEIDIALDILMVADCFNRRISQNSHSLYQTAKSMKKSPPDNLNPVVIEALVRAIEKDELKIH